MGKHTHIHTYKCIHHIQRELEEVRGREEGGGGGEEKLGGEHFNQVAF